MSDTPTPPPVDEGLLRYLRRLVTLLTGVMIVGLLVIIGLFVTKFSGSAPARAPLALPDAISLPGGTTATAFTQGRDWFAVVTQDNQILIYDTQGALRQTVTITSE